MSSSLKKIPQLKIEKKYKFLEKFQHLIDIRSIQSYMIQEFKLKHRVVINCGNVEHFAYPCREQTIFKLPEYISKET